MVPCGLAVALGAHGAGPRSSKAYSAKGTAAELVALRSRRYREERRHDAATQNNRSNGAHQMVNPMRGHSKQWQAATRNFRAREKTLLARHAAQRRNVLGTLHGRTAVRAHGAAAVKAHGAASLFSPVASQKTLGDLLHLAGQPVPPRTHATSKRCPDCNNIIVLGSGYSGTSTITAELHRLGWMLGEAGQIILGLSEEKRLINLQQRYVDATGLLGVAVSTTDANREVEALARRHRYAGLQEITQNYDTQRLVDKYALPTILKQLPCAPPLTSLAPASCSAS